MPYRQKDASAEHGKTGVLKVLQRLNSYEFAVEIEIMRDGLNNNRWDYRNIKENYLSFLGQPILIAYVGSKVGDGHNMREIVKPDGERVYTFVDGTSERIIGTLSEDPSDFRLEEKGGQTWIVAKGKIFAFYAREAVEKIITTGVMSVSAETDIFEVEKLADGIEIYHKWAGLGVTILGDDVPPAIPGARIKAMNSLKDEFEGLKLRAASLVRGDKPEENKKEQKGVKHKMNKRELAQIQSQLTDYVVLGASDDGKHICLLSKQTGYPFGYTFSADSAEKNIVVPDLVTGIRANAVFAFDGDQVQMDMDSVLEHFSTMLARVNSDLKAANEKIEKLEGEADAMIKKENARRVNAAKKAVKDKLAAMNLNRTEKTAFAAELADRVCGQIDAGMYVNDEDEHGEWCGDAHAVCALQALCMEKQEEMDKDAKAKAEQHRALSWNEIETPVNTDAGDLDSLTKWLDE